MKTLTKLFMLATLMVNSATVWAASSVEPTSEQRIEQAYSFATETKKKLADPKVTGKLRKNLTKQYVDDVNNLEKACKRVCEPVVSGKEKFCEQHCTLDKHGHPVEPKLAGAKEEEHKEAAA